MPLKPELRRDRPVIFRLSEGEYAEVEAAAAGSRSVSDWLRDVVLASARTAGREGAAKREGER